jgi:hypothetical protein
MTVCALSWRHTSTHNERSAVSMQRATLGGVITLHPTSVSVVNLQCNIQIIQPMWKLSGKYLLLIFSNNFIWDLRDSSVTIVIRYRSSDRNSCSGREASFSVRQQAQVSTRDQLPSCPTEIWGRQMKLQLI